MVSVYTLSGRPAIDEAIVSCLCLCQDLQESVDFLHSSPHRPCSHDASAMQPFTCDCINTQGHRSKLPLQAQLPNSICRGRSTSFCKAAQDISLLPSGRGRCSCVYLACKQGSPNGAASSAA